MSGLVMLLVLMIVALVVTALTMFAQLRFPGRCGFGWCGVRSGIGRGPNVVRVRVR